MTRENYKGPIFGQDKGIMFPLGLTVEQIQQALIENKKLQNIQAAFMNFYM